MNKEVVILITEDDDGHAGLIRKNLARAGIINEMIHFKDGQEIVDFLCQADHCGKVNARQSKQIYELIKECDGDGIFGYIGRPDCAKMSDMKDIFSDKTSVRWY